MGWGVRGPGGQGADIPAAACRSCRGRRSHLGLALEVNTGSVDWDQSYTLHVSILMRKKHNPPYMIPRWRNGGLEQEESDCHAGFKVPRVAIGWSANVGRLRGPERRGPRHFSVRSGMVPRFR